MSQTQPRQRCRDLGQRHLRHPLLHGPAFGHGGDDAGVGQLQVLAGLPKALGHFRCAGAFHFKAHAGLAQLHHRVHLGPSRCAVERQTRARGQVGGDVFDDKALPRRAGAGVPPTSR